MRKNKKRKSEIFYKFCIGSFFCFQFFSFKGWSEELTAIDLYKQAKNCVLQADTALEQKEYPQALDLYQTALTQLEELRQRYPQWTSMILAELQIEKSKEKINKIRDMMPPAIAVEETSPQNREQAFHSLTQRGDSLLAGEDYERALEQYDQALTLMPDDKYVSVNRGIVLFKLQRIQKSIDQFKDIIGKEDQYSPAYYNLGDVYYSIGYVFEAMDCYKKAIAINPDDFRSRINLGVILVKKEFYNDALNHFQYIVQKDPDFAEAHYNLGVIYSDYLFEKTKAIYHYSKYLDLMPEAKERKQVEDWIEGLRMVPSGEQA